RAMVEHDPALLLLTAGPGIDRYAFAQRKDSFPSWMWHRSRRHGHFGNPFEEVRRDLPGEPAHHRLEILEPHGPTSGGEGGLEMPLQLVDGHAILLHRIAMPHGDGVRGERVPIDGDAERRAGLVHPAI